MGTYRQALQTITQQARQLLSRESVNVRVMTAESLTLEKVWSTGTATDGQFVLPLEQLTLRSNKTISMDAVPKTEQTGIFSDVWQRIRFCLGFAKYTC